ncbi:GNAT family N-acetyltransferase [Streptomyces lydicus]|uniref:GNAT family N-acetyltransferase n=1 Tax=Streptomyces lydicus TaxID=47763 RepID=UPI0036FD098D
MLPVAGVTWVGMAPTHRRRGVLTSLMRKQLTELHDSAGEPIVRSVPPRPRSTAASATAPPPARTSSGATNDPCTSVPEPISATGPSSSWTATQPGL